MPGLDLLLVYCIYIIFLQNLYLSLRVSQCVDLLVAPPGWLSGKRVGLGPGGCEFKTRLRRTFFPAYFRLSPLLKHLRKVVGGFGKKVVLVLVWECQETHVNH